MDAMDTQNDAIHLNERRDGDARVVIHPGDNDVFVRTGKQVIEACRLDISIELWLSELATMQGFVREWAGQRAGKIRSCFIVGRGSKVVIFVAPQGEQFDFDLADEMTMLDAQVSQYNIGPVDLRQVPWSEMDRFVNPERAMHVYGETPKPHSAMEA